MSSRRVAELDDTCLEAKHDVDTDPFAIQVRPQVFEEMRDQDFPVNDVLSLYTNVSLKQDGNKGYVVGEIETLEYPQELADYEVDQTTVWFCTCPGWNFHHNKEFPADARPSDVDPCPHVEKCKRKERQAVDDESQTDLGEVME